MGSRHAGLHGRVLPLALAIKRGPSMQRLPPCGEIENQRLMELRINPTARPSISKDSSAFTTMVG